MSTPAWLRTAWLTIGGYVMSIALASAGQTIKNADPIKPEELPARKAPVATARPRTATPWTPARTPWGDPDVSGVFTNNDESGIPFERPKEFEGKRIEDVDARGLATLVQQRQAPLVLEQFQAEMGPWRRDQLLGVVRYPGVRLGHGETLVTAVSPDYILLLNRHKDDMLPGPS